MTRPRGFIDEWRPQAKTRALIEQIHGVLDEYAVYLPLTLRQIFYRLVSNGALGKTERDYARLCELANRARRAQLIPFDAIRDDGLTRREPVSYTDTSEFLGVVTYSAKQFRLDRQAGQETRLMVWCEAAGMVPQLVSVASDYGVPVISSGGFDSLTTKHEMAQAIASGDEPVEVLHIGDHDPSGVHVFLSLADDIGAFCDAMGGESMFTRLAVTPEQVAMFDLPTAPPKRTDKRAFSGETTQAEALPPDLLAELLLHAIESRMDLDLFDATKRAELVAQTRLVDALGSIQS